MEYCQYESVPSKTESVTATKGIGQWKPFLRQLLICSGVWCAMFVIGLCIGAPTVFIPQIRREANSTNVITDEMASWLTSVNSFSTSLFVIILTASIRFFGRKNLYLFGVIDSFAAFILLYYSSNVMHILISSIMQGLFTAALKIFALLILTECTSPKYRGLFITIKVATFYWGVWVSNAIGTFFHWKIIPLIGIACTMYSFLTAIICPESPYWLIIRGKFKECVASHRWLKGCDEESEKELQSLRNFHKENIARYEGQQISIKDSVIEIFKTFQSKEFYKPVTLCAMTGLLNIFTGKIICVVYAIDILKKITNDESSAYIGMLILDGITVFSMYVGCILARFVKRRTLLLTTLFISGVVLYILSLYLYLIKLCVIYENKFLSIFLLTLFSIAVSCGPLIISVSVTGELIPIRSRNLAVCILVVILKIGMALSLKTAPFLFKTFGLHGSFLTFGISSSISLLILYRYLPETKDKTLQEIAESVQA